MNDCKRFAFWAAIAAAFILLSAGASAAATVRCVPSTSLDPGCTVPTTYATIQDAVNASSAGDIIVVGPGTYTPFKVPPGKDGLVLLGAQAGHDARDEERDDPSEESIVNASGVTPSSAIIVESKNVIVDGFTAQGGTNLTPGNATGIDLKGVGGTPQGLDPGTDASGGKVLNNILQDNGTGVSLNSEGFGPISNVLVEHNLFRHNNGGTASNGDGLFTSAMNNVVITENKFSANKTSALGINNSNNVTMTYNRSDDDASFVIFTGTTNANFSDNEGKRFGHAGTFPGAGDAAVAIGPGNSFLVINNNELDHGEGFISRGIAVTKIFGTGVDSNLTIAYNEVKRFPGSGITADTGMTLTNARFLGNESDRNGADGIFLATGDSTNLLNHNEAHGNSGFDCHDTTGPLNIWFRNFGNTSSPSGLCIKDED
jgi:hypothetical protein